MLYPVQRQVRARMITRRAVNGSPMKLMGLMIKFRFIKTVLTNPSTEKRDLKTIA